MGIKNLASSLILVWAALFITSSVGCDQAPHHRHKKHDREIDCYRHQNDDNTWLYYYVLFDSHSNTYYSYESTTQVTTFSGVNWTSSKVDPTETQEFQNVGYDEQPAVAIPGDELPAEIEVDLEAGDPAVEGAESSDGGSAVGSDESEGSSEGDGGSSGGDGGSSGGDGGGGDGGGGD